MISQATSAATEVCTIAHARPRNGLSARPAEPICGGIGTLATGHFRNSAEVLGHWIAQHHLARRGEPTPPPECDEFAAGRRHGCHAGQITISTIRLRAEGPPTSALGKVVMDHFSCLEGDVGHRVGHPHDLPDSKLRQGHHRVRV